MDNMFYRELYSAMSQQQLTIVQSSINGPVRDSLKRLAEY